MMNRVNLNAIRTNHLKFYSSSSGEWTSNKVRKQFVDYFKERDHEFVRPIPLLNKDKNPLLVNAGMNQFKPIFLNNEQLLNESPYLKQLTKAVNYQKCVRLSGKHNDFEEVGKDFTHQTFFEMLGNWSFNNCYFKEDACKYAFDLLTNYFGIDKQRLIVTYFGGDPNLNLKEDLETKEIWLNLGFPQHKVIPLQDNLWDMADQGPCGVCTELHYVNNAELINSVNSSDLLKNSIEIWNLVFIQYERTNNELKDLKSRHVDTGLGLERILAILNGKQSNFDTDLFVPLIRILETELTKTSIKYTNTLTEPIDIKIRIVVDHIRAICVLLTDDVLPSHTNEGIIVRKLIRRTNDLLRNDFKETVPKRILLILIQQVIELLKDAYPELATSKDKIVKYVFSEIQWQLTTTHIVRTFIRKLKKKSESRILCGQDALKLRKKGAILKDELDRLAEEQGFKVDWNEHDEIVKEEIRKSKEIKAKKQNAANT